MITKEKSLKKIDEISSELISISDNIWDHPEIGYHENYAASLYCDYLKENGFIVEEQLCGIPTAFCASYGNGNPVIGILAEFDALTNMSQQAEILEKKPVAEGQPGHGCGHNLLGAASLGAAMAIKEYLRNGHPGTVKFFGCPAEETGGGKIFMTRDGAFDTLDIAITWHPADSNLVGTGSSLANQQILYHFRGKSSHAAICPELGRSALDAVELMNVGVQFLREHVPGDCRIHYSFANSGGDTPGIVHAAADVRYLMRAKELETVQDLRERIDNIARGAALMTDTSVDIEFVKACSNTLPNRTLASVMQKNLEDLGGPEFDDKDRKLAEDMRSTMERKDPYYKELVNEIRDPEIRERLIKDIDAPLYEQILPLSEAEHCSSASTDVGDVSQICPTVQLYLVTMPAGTGMHSWQQVAVGKSSIAHKGMLQAARIMAAAAIDIYEEPAIIDQAVKEKNKRTNNKKYICPIPKEISPWGN